MARRKTLVVLTTAFPYGGTFEKNFLHPEVRHLRERFEELEFVPAKVIGEIDPFLGSLKIDDGLATRLGFPKKGRMFVHVLRGIRIHYGYREKAAKSFERMTTIGRVANFANLGMAGAAYSFLKEGLVAGRWNLAETLFYSYWCKYPALALAWLKQEDPNLCAVTRAHGSDLYVENAPYQVVSGQRAIVNVLDRIFTISDHGMRYLETMFPEAADKIHVARLGTLAPGFRCRPSEDGMLRIVSCSRIEPVKRVERIFESVLAAKGAFPGNIEWFHIGGGKGFQKLDRLTRDRSIAGVSVTLTGSIPLSEIMRLYADRPWDVFINASHSEGVPVSMMEAMSCGLPCVGPAVGGVPELVSPLAGGELVPPDATPAQIASAVLKVAGNREAWLERSERAFQHWRSGFSAERNFATFSQQLADI